MKNLNKLSNYKTLLWFIFFWIWSTPSSHAQDPNYTQFYISPISLNPAFTGTTPHYRFSTIYRNQWITVPGSYETNLASFEYNWDYYHSGVGIILSNDRAKEFGYMINSIQLAYAYQAQLTKTRFIRFGIQGGYAIRNIGYNSLLFGDQINTGGPTQEDLTGINQGFPDFSFGTVYYSQLFWGGIAIHHINTPRLNLGTTQADNYPARISAHIGGRMVFKNGKKEVFKIQPAILAEKQAESIKVTGGVNFATPSVFAGAWLRAFSDGGQDAASFLVGFRTGDFKFAYNYDVTISNLSGQTGGSHEISITIEPRKDYRYKGKAKWSKFLECPVVF